MPNHTSYLQNKKFLSFIRNGDYAHAGEEEAIELAMSGIEKNPQRNILDVGCGLGGTANYLQTLLSNNGWQLKSFEDVSTELLTWYATLNQRIKSNEKKAKEIFSDEQYNRMLTNFTHAYELVKEKKLGGAIIKATTLEFS